MSFCLFLLSMRLLLLTRENVVRKYDLFSEMPIFAILKCTHCEVLHSLSVPALAHPTACGMFCRALFAGGSIDALAGEPHQQQFAGGTFGLSQLCAPRGQLSLVEHAQSAFGHLLSFGNERTESLQPLDAPHRRGAGRLQRHAHRLFGGRTATGLAEQRLFAGTRRHHPDPQRTPRHTHLPPQARQSLLCARTAPRV